MAKVLRVTRASTTVDIRLDDLRVLHRLREAYTRHNLRTQVLTEVLVADVGSNLWRHLGFTTGVHFA